MNRPILIGTAALLAWSLGHASAQGGDVQGTIEIRVPQGASDSSKGRIVIWLETEEQTRWPHRKHTISQKNAQFSPRFLTVVRGETVDMPNDDNIVHNVFSFSKAKRFNLGIYPKGKMKSVTFEKCGTIKMYCSIHRNMNATILVVPTRWYVEVDKAGRFKIPGVPAGKYRIGAWRAGTKACELQPIEVKAGGIEDIRLALETKPPRKRRSKGKGKHK